MRRRTFAVGILVIVTFLGALGADLFRKAPLPHAALVAAWIAVLALLFMFPVVSPRLSSEQRLLGGLHIFLLSFAAFRLAHLLWPHW
jgi:hypothetical protein